MARPRSCPSGPRAARRRARRRSAACADSAAHSSSNTGVSRSDRRCRGPVGARPQPSSTTRPRGPPAAARPTASARPRRRSPRTSRRRGGAADERAVDVGQREQLGGVVGLDAAAVEDPRALGLLASAVADERADEARSPPAPARASPPGRCRSPRSARRRSRRRRARSVDAARGPPGPGGGACARCRRSRAPPRSRRRTGSASRPAVERGRHLQRQRPVGLAEQLAALGVAEHHAVRRRPRTASAPTPRR